MFPVNATTILLIDDSPEDRHTYISFLQSRREGLYTFLEADNAEEGLQICAQTHLDCIILDFDLPDMSGLEFLDKLTQASPTGRPPVIMMTGRGSEHVAVAALKAGASDYLIKSDASAQSVFRATHNALEVSQLNKSLSQEMRDREGAEADLRESESRYRLLVESVRDYAIMMLDTEGKITSWNAGARRLFGYHDDEVLNEHVRRLYPAKSERAHDADLELRAASTSGSHTSDGYLVRKDGTEFWSTGHISPVHDRSGYLCGYSKIVRQTARDEARYASADPYDTSFAQRLRQEALEPLKQLRGRIDASADLSRASTQNWRSIIDAVVTRVEKMCE